MADDIRLVIGVEQSGLLKAITNTESLEKKVKKLSDAYARDAVSYGRYNKAIGNLATATKKSKKELLDYGKAVRADEKATKQAALATKQFAQARRDAIAEDQRRTAAAKKATQVAAQQSAEEDRLKNKFVQGYTAASIYSKELNDLGIARKKGIISIEQQRVALDRLNKEYAEGSGRFAMYANAMGKSANRAGVAMQQTGYQVGDFLVQVQSGTNPMVAFGQQATQLVGVMYLLPQATLAAKLGFMGLQVSMGAIIAVVSILIPLATAIGAYFLRAGEDAKKASGDIDTYANAIDNLNNKLKGLLETRLSETTKFDADILVASQKRLQIANKIAEVQRESAGYTGDKKRFADNLIKTLEKELAVETKKIDFLMSRIRQEEAAAKKREAEANSQKSANTNLQGQLDNLGKRANEWSRSMSKGYKEAQDATAVFKEQERLQQQALRLQDVALKYGVDSTQYRKEENKIERENLALKLEQAGVDDSHIQNVLLGNMALEAGLRLLEAQRDVTYSMFEGSDAAKRMRKYAGRGTPTGTGQPSTKSTGSSVVKESDLSKLQNQLDLEDALLGKTEARQRVIQALGIDFVKKNANTVAGLEAQIIATQNLIRIEEERKELVDTVTGSMENNLMALADGTKSVKSAFRDMARDIIAHLYKVLVVQQMVNAATAFFGFADGGVFSGGSQVQAYANGGVVGGPTTFPMAGGKTGLMGEAGPEAIMPLKRGANGKLGVQMEGGGGQNVVINQSFNFTANGDDSVKKIIAQAAPQIAQMTKKSMLDDRRRGGQMKATFG